MASYEYETPQSQIRPTDDSKAPGAPGRKRTRQVARLTTEGIIENPDVETKGIVRKAIERFVAFCNGLVDVVFGNRH